jgi:hypothetical protein
LAPIRPAIEMAIRSLFFILLRTDRGIWWNWAIPGVVFSAAAFIVVLLMGMRGRVTTQNV